VRSISSYVGLRRAIADTFSKGVRMRKLVLASIVTMSGLIGASACTSSPPSPTVSFTAPIAAQPANGASYKYKQQPVTLTITNAARTGDAATTYSLEVASDPGFTNKIVTKDSIPEGSGGTTSVTVGPLPASGGNVTYYWRWKATVDGVSSNASAPQSFVVQQQIVINAPVLVGPTNGSTVSEARPTFTVKNATRQGAAGAITYLFQVSNSSSFASILASQTVAEQSSQTSWTPGSNLPEGTLYWRAQASDASNGESSSFTTSTSFLIQLFDLKNATIVNSPQDLASWPQTTTISSVVFTDDAMLVDFDKRGPGGWPESSFGVQYTLGMCLNIGGHWYCSGVVHFWTGRELEASGKPYEVGQQWFYGRWGIMDGYQPRCGEVVGFFVAQGNIRDNSNESSLKERSDVALVPFCGSYFKK
jgi:hypothetical protein